MADARIATALDRLRAAADRIGARTQTTVEVRVRSAVAPAPADPRLLECVRAAADERGLARLELPSGAGHDAQVMAALGPIGMVFAPSIGGISHAPRETTDPAHLVAGAEVLCAALVRADAALSTPDTAGEPGTRPAYPLG
jgi:acetylornithine deacetylase/succinyl-diaminopimelate desuccinylase-like protein